MCHVSRISLISGRFLRTGTLKLTADSIESKIRHLRMNASTATLVFFANSYDKTEYFHSQHCAKVAQGLAIKNFIKSYPDAVYTTARISGEEYMVFSI